MDKRLLLSVFVALLFSAYVMAQHGGVVLPFYNSGKNSTPSPIDLAANVTTSQIGPDALGASSSGASASAQAAPGQRYKDGKYAGSVQDAYYGNVQVGATVQGGKITAVDFLQAPNTHQTSVIINSQAMPILQAEAIQAQSAKVDIVSGATFTSQAYQASLADALSQATNTIAFAGAPVPASNAPSPPSAVPSRTAPPQGTQAVPLPAAAPNQTVAPASQPPAAGTGSRYNDGQYTGSVQDAYYGNVQVGATVQGGQLTAVNFLQYPNTHGTSVIINSQAMPILQTEAIQAQSANVNIVSGATFTSQAYQASLADALAQAINPNAPAANPGTPGVAPAPAQNTTVSQPPAPRRIPRGGDEYGEDD